MAYKYQLFCTRKIIDICNQRLSPSNGKITLGGEFLVLLQPASPLVCCDASVILSPSQPYECQTWLLGGITAYHGCGGDTSQLLVGGRSLQDASKIKAVDEVEPPLSLFFSPPFFLMEVYFL